MLKKMYTKKILLASFALLILLILYLIPNNSNKSNLQIDTDKIEYVYPNNLSAIYLLDSYDYVARTVITSCSCDSLDKATDLIEGLIIDGKKSNIIPNGFRSIIPSGTKVNDISLEDKVLTIDFSKELLEINEKYEEKMIESLIYTLTSIEGIDKVIIKVDNNILTSLPNSKKTLPTILDKEYGINKTYELVSTLNIDSYITYYVNSYNDNYYYVPVTKYINNKNQDKIEVIIDELSTSYVYETNLMSFLNVGARLIDYEKSNNILKLNFNNLLLSDIANGNILEEVVYTIGLSMSDNFNVDEVVFYVEDEEFYKFLPKNP